MPGSGCPVSRSFHHQQPPDSLQCWGLSLCADLLSLGWGWSWGLQGSWPGCIVWKFVSYFDYFVAFPFKHFITLNGKQEN